MCFSFHGIYRKGCKNGSVSFQVPPPGKCSLCNRLFLTGTEALLGLAPAPEYTFLAYLCFSCRKLLQGCSSSNSGYLVRVVMTLDLVTVNRYICVTCCTRILINNSKCVLVVRFHSILMIFSHKSHSKQTILIFL